MSEELKRYENAFHLFKSFKVVSYELYCANRLILELHNKLKDESEQFRKWTPYFLIKEKRCEDFLKKEFPELKDLIETFLKYSPALVEEENLFQERNKSFPFCKTAIKVLQNNGIKIKKVYNEGRSGVYIFDKNEIQINPHLCGEEQRATLLHERHHAFYQLPLLRGNVLIECLIEEGMEKLLEDKEIVISLDALLSYL